MGSDGRQIAATKDMGVVLPGSARRWTLKTPTDIPAELVVTSSRGKVRSKVVVEQPSLPRADGGRDLGDSCPGPARHVHAAGYVSAIQQPALHTPTAEQLVRKDC